MTAPAAAAAAARALATSAWLLAGCAPALAAPTERVCRPVQGVDLAAARGRVVLVEYFATWCESCHEALLFYDALQRRHPESLEVVAVSLDEDQGALRAFLAQTPLRVRIVRDPSQRAAEAMDVRALPTALVVDRAGCVRDRVESARASERERVAAIVEDLAR